MTVFMLIIRLFKFTVITVVITAVNIYITRLKLTLLFQREYYNFHLPFTKHQYKNHPMTCVETHDLC